MVPYEPEHVPVLADVSALICGGRRDPIVPAGHADQLAAMLRSGGANVTVAWQDAGHGLVQADVDAASAFLTESPA
jgi:predicted esterase